MLKVRENYLAPMENYTNLAFRILMQKHGAKATIAPLVSATAIARSAKALEKLEIHTDEKFLGVQLVGSIPEDFSVAAKAIFDNYPYIKWFDINAGCPSAKTIGTGCGAALLDRSKTISKIIQETKKVGLPVSVKMRLADSMKKTLAFVEAAQEADLLIVHGRTIKQGYSGKVNWDAIKEIKENSEIPIVGNGDIKTMKEGKKLVRSGFCNSFMIGRAALSNPLVFEGKKAKTKEIKKSIFLEYLSLSEKYLARGPDLFDLKLKCFEFFKNLEGSAAFRGHISKSNSIEEIKEKIKEF